MISEMAQNHVHCFKHLIVLQCYFFFILEYQKITLFLLWHTSAPYMSTCNIIMFTWNIVMSTCQIIMLTCHINHVVCMLHVDINHLACVWMCSHHIFPFICVCTFKNSSFIFLCKLLNFKILQSTIFQFCHDQRLSRVNFNKQSWHFCWSCSSVS